MSASIFDKILRIVNVVLTILQFAIRSFTGTDSETEVSDE